jgi:hypothetical protein
LTPRERAAAHLAALRVAAVTAMVAMGSDAAAGDPPPTPPPRPPRYAVVDPLPPPANCGEEITAENLDRWAVANGTWSRDEGRGLWLLRVQLSWRRAAYDETHEFADVRVAGGTVDSFVAGPPRSSVVVVVVPEGPGPVQVLADARCSGRTRVEGTIEWEFDTEEPKAPNASASARVVRFVDPEARKPAEKPQ